MYLCVIILFKMKKNVFFGCYYLYRSFNNIYFIFLKITDVSTTRPPRTPSPYPSVAAASPILRTPEYFNVSWSPGPDQPETNDVSDEKASTVAVNLTPLLLIPDSFTSRSSGDNSAIVPQGKHKHQIRFL